MNVPKIPHNEHLRLEELIELGILDTPPEEKFDRITRIAKSYFKVSTSLVTMIDGDRQWFKSSQGLDIKETPRNISFCAHAILQDDIFIVENANLDIRFQENPLVIGLPYFQFYAGVPLHGPNGLLIGTLCIFDTKPRSMSSDDIATLNELAVLVELSLGIARLSQMAMQTKKSEAKLSAIWNNIVDGIITIDTVGNIESVNQAALNMFGYLEVELVGKNISMLMLSPLQEQYDVDSLQYVESAPSKILGIGREVTGKRKNGPIFPMELSMSEMWIEGTRYYISIVRDISSRVETMNALISSEKRWKFAVEGAGDGVWDWDVQSNTVAYSKRWKEMLGHSEEEIGSSAEEWSSRVHPDDMPRLSQIIQNHLEGKVPYFTDEHRFKCKDGSWLWIHDRGLVVSRDLQGNPLRVVGTHTDISERKKSEFLIKDTMEKLSQAKELLQTTINNVPALVAYWDDQLINRFANSAYFDWFGFTPSQMYGKHIREIIGNGRFEDIQDKLTSVLNGNVEVFERTVNDRSGIKRHTVFSYTPEIRDGIVRGCYGFLSDITPLKEAQLDKEKALSQLQSTFDAASEFSIITTNLDGIIIGFSAGAERMLELSLKFSLP